MIEQYGSGIAYKCDLCGGSPARVGECYFGALVFKEPDKISRELRGEQMKKRLAAGSSKNKRLNHLAESILKDAVRIWGLFRDRRPDCYAPILTLDGGPGL